MILAADLPAKITGVRAIHVGSLATVVRPIGEALRLLVLREKVSTTTCAGMRWSDQECAGVRRRK